MSPASKSLPFSSSGESCLGFLRFSNFRLFPICSSVGECLLGVVLRFPGANFWTHMDWLASSRTRSRDKAVVVVDKYLLNIFLFIIISNCPTFYNVPFL